MFYSGLNVTMTLSVRYQLRLARQHGNVFCLDHLSYMNQLAVLLSVTLRYFVPLHVNSDVERCNGTPMEHPVKVSANTCQHADNWSCIDHLKAEGNEFPKVLRPKMMSARCICIVANCKAFADRYSTWRSLRNLRGENADAVCIILFICSEL